MATAKKKADKPKKRIRFEYEGDEYVLEFNRNALRMLDERYDFSYNDLEKLQVSKLPDLFYCAFMMHHSNVKRSKSDEIWDMLGGKEDVIMTLIEMYAGVMNSIMESNAEEGKAIAWTAE